MWGKGGKDGLGERSQHSAVSVREAQCRERAGGAGGATECRVNRQLTHIMWMSTFENKNPVTL